ncbi:MAG: hypothetical protein ABH845_01305 [Candidatus Omnitrophota bacterium]
MKRQGLSEALFLMGFIVFVAGVILKITAQEVFLFPVVAYWRFSMGCLALSMALSLLTVAEKK